MRSFYDIHEVDFECPHGKGWGHEENVVPPAGVNRMATPAKYIPPAIQQASNETLIRYGDSIMDDALALKFAEIKKQYMDVDRDKDCPGCLRRRVVASMRTFLADNIDLIDKRELGL
jgi:hypothetical protein